MHNDAETVEGLRAELLSLRQQLNTLEQANETLHRQHEMFQLLAGVSDLASALEIIIDHGNRIANLDCGGIYLVKPPGQLTMVAHQGLTEDFVEQVSLYPADAPQTKMVLPGQPVYGHYADVAAQPFVAEGLQAVAIIPVLYKQAVIAVLNLASHSENEISPPARDLLEAMAAMLGHVIARLKADADWKESRRQYQLLATNMPGAVFHCDIDAHWTMHFINDAIENISLYPASDFVQNRIRSFASIIHPADRQYVTKTIEQAIEQHQPYSLEYRIINAAGKICWVSERGQKVSGKNQLTGAIFDITDRKKAEQKVDEYRSRLEALISQRTAKLKDTNERLKLEALERQLAQDSLQQSQIKFQNFIDQSHDGIVLTDETGRVIEWNLAQEKITGVGREAAVGQFIWDVQMRLMPQCENSGINREIFKVSQEQVLNTGRAPWLGNLQELSIQHADGSERFVQQSAFVIKTDRGFMLGSIHRDITDAKQAEKALSDSELLYHSLVEHLPQNIFRKDRQGRFVFVNSSYCQTEGKTADQIIGKTDYDLHPPELARKYWEDDQQVMATGQVSSITEIHQPIDGPKTYVRVVKTPVYDSEGQLAGIQGIFWDITARKQAEGQIRARNRELALLNKIIATTTNEQNTESMLEAVCRELGRMFETIYVSALLVNPARTTAVIVAEYQADSSNRTMLGQEFPIEKNPLYQQLFIQKAPVVISDALNDPRTIFEQELLNLSDPKIKSTLVAPLIVQNDLIGVISLKAHDRDNFNAEEVSLVWNVADQVSGALARVRLTEAHQRLATAVEQSASSIFIADKNGIIIYVNSTFEKLSGYRASEAIGQTPALLKSGQQDEATYRQLWATILAGKTWQGNLINKNKSGGLFTVDTTITPVRNEFDQITSFICVQRDISRELVLEEQYRQAQKMEAVGQLTAGIAHDFNNILTGINGFAELMELQLADPSMQYYAGRIKSAGQRAANLVRQLLVFSRKQAVQPEVLQLNAVIVDIEKLLTRIIGEHIQMVTHLDADLGQIHIDPGQIEQIIVNLSVNARDAMPDGGKLIIETANISLDETEAERYLELPPGEYVQLAVSDNGHGMSKAVESRIFEPFFTTKEYGKGTGLGLATVYGIIKQNNGYISVYSEQGQGTTFKVYLPRTKQSSSTTGAHLAQPGSLPRGDATILLVEDNDDVRDLTRRLLERQGYTVLVAYSAENALETVSHHQGTIDLLLTDIVLPGINGKELAEQCAEICPNLKVIYMSGYTSDIIAPEGLRDSLIQKPFNAMHLLSKIKNVLALST